MPHDNTLEVRAIENGTVIDHIPPGSLFQIINILKLESEKNRITFGMNLESKRMGTKAIIKINGRYCQPDEINRIALVAPSAKVNIIEDYRVSHKLMVTVPDSVEGFIRCINPKCITNNEPVATAFEVIKGERVSLRCRYCEKITPQSRFEIIK